MVDSRYLPIPNQRVEIAEIAATPVESPRVHHQSRRRKRRAITVVCPMSQGEIVPLRKGSKVTVTYIRDRTAGI